MLCYFLERWLFCLVIKLFINISTFYVLRFLRFFLTIYTCFLAFYPSFLYFCIFSSLFEGCCFLVVLGFVIFPPCTMFSEHCLHAPLSWRSLLSSGYIPSRWSVYVYLLWGSLGWLLSFWLWEDFFVYLPYIALWLPFICITRF